MIEASTGDGVRQVGWPRPLPVEGEGENCDDLVGLSRGGNRRSG